MHSSLEAKPSYDKSTVKINVPQLGLWATAVFQLNAYLNGQLNSARIFWRSTSMGTSRPSAGKCQKVHPLQLAAPWTAAPT
mgnify:CR=1 FL=1